MLLLGKYLRTFSKYNQFALVYRLHRISPVLTKYRKIIIIMYGMKIHNTYGWAPINKLDGSLGLDSGNGSIDIFWNNITTVEQAASHVFAILWITLDHLILGLETCICDFLNTV